MIVKAWIYGSGHARSFAADAENFKEPHWNQKVVSVPVISSIESNGLSCACNLWNRFIRPFPRVYRRAQAYPLPRKMPAKAEKSCTIRAVARYGDGLEVVRLCQTCTKAES